MNKSRKITSYNHKEKFAGGFSSKFSGNSFKDEDSITEKRNSIREKASLEAVFSD